MRLYDYWRSSSAYRVRIALRLKGIEYQQLPVNLRQGVQRTLDYLAHNRQGLVPALEAGETTLTQSLAIIEWLDEIHPEPPLLPSGAEDRALVRSLAQQLACEIQPLGNLRVLLYLKNRLGLDDRDVNGWYRHWIAEGFASLEQRLAASAGSYCVGERVTLADLCLVPQVYNARRYSCDLDPYPTIRRIDAACQKLPAFAEAKPERQPDAA
ncbi:MAG: maleylacetoacetate isomerase [Geminicoccaceae bacterium]